MSTHAAAVPVDILYTEDASQAAAAGALSRARMTNACNVYETLSLEERCLMGANCYDSRDLQQLISLQQASMTAHQSERAHLEEGA